MCGRYDSSAGFPQGFHTDCTASGHFPLQHSPAASRLALSLGARVAESGHARGRGVGGLRGLSAAVGACDAGAPRAAAAALGRVGLARHAEAEERWAQRCAWDRQDRISAEAGVWVARAGTPTDAQEGLERNY